MPWKSRFDWSKCNPRRLPRWFGSAAFALALGINAFNFALPMGFRIGSVVLMVFCLYRCTNMVRAQRQERANLELDVEAESEDAAAG